MSDVKWDELRRAMYALRPAPAFSIVSLRGFRAPPAHDWYYQFRSGGYQRIHYVDIGVTEALQCQLVRAALQRIEVPVVALKLAESDGRELAAAERTGAGVTARKVIGDFAALPVHQGGVQQGEPHQGELHQGELHQGEEPGCRGFRVFGYLEEGQMPASI